MPVVSPCVGNADSIALSQCSGTSTEAQKELKPIEIRAASSMIKN